MPMRGHRGFDLSLIPVFTPFPLTFIVPLSPHNIHQDLMEAHTKKHSVPSDRKVPMPYALPLPPSFLIITPRFRDSQTSLLSERVIGPE